MRDPMIRVMERRPAASGFWVQNFRGGDLIYADAHLEAGSSVVSAYPVMDRCDAYRVERAIDWILNAAAASRDRVARAFRAVYPGSRVESEALQSDWWGRQFDGVVGIDFSAYFGREAAVTADRSRAGLVIDDSTTLINVSGFSTVSGSQGYRGSGPGGGGGLFNGGYAGGGGHGTAGEKGRRTDGAGALGGPAIPAVCAIEALRSGTYTATTLSMGGSGGTDGHEGGDAGDGIVRISSGKITESMDRSFTGSQASHSYGGAGSGGGYYIVSRRGYSLASGTTVELAGGARQGSSSTRYPGAGGNGRFTTFTVEQPSIDGTVSNGVLTHFQIYPSIPLGAVRVM